MAKCLLCESGEAVVEARADLKRASCPTCREYTISDAFCDELAGNPEVRATLSRVTRWYAYRQQPLQLLNHVLAEWAIFALKEFEEDAERRGRLAVNALARADGAEDPWREPVLAVSKALGISPQDAESYARDLLARGIVRIVTPYRGQPMPGAIPLPTLHCWEAVLPQPATNPDKPVRNVG